MKPIKIETKNRKKEKSYLVETNLIVEPTRIETPRDGIIQGGQPDVDIQLDIHASRCLTTLLLSIGR